MEKFMPLVLVFGKTGDYYLHPATSIQARNPISIEGDTVRIMLRGGKYAVIDLDDFPRIASLRWSPDGLGYAQTSMRVNGKQRKLRLHRFLIGPEATGRIVDHRDGERWNCCRGNLRLGTQAQNVLNRGPNKTSLTGFKGVSEIGKTGMFRARIKNKGSHIQLGVFASREEAALAYDEAAQRLFEEWARPNFPRARK